MSTIRKAITGAVLAGVAAFVEAYPEGFTDLEVGKIIAAIVVAGILVYRIPNADRKSSTS